MNSAAVVRVQKRMRSTLVRGFICVVGGHYIVEEYALRQLQCIPGWLIMKHALESSVSNEGLRR